MCRSRCAWGSRLTRSRAWPANPAAGGFTERQRALLAVSDELLAERTLSDATWSAVQASFPDREAIELCLLIGNYQGLASTIGALGIQVQAP